MEHTCERHGRPLCTPLSLGSGGGPGRLLIPRSLARSITHTRARLRQHSSSQETRGEGGIGRERAQGQTPHPPHRPLARAHRRKPKHNLERPRRFQGPQRAQSLNTGKAPSQERPPPREASPCQGRGTSKFSREASQSGDQVAHPGLPSPQVCAAERTQMGSSSAWVSVLPSMSQPGQPRTGAQKMHPSRGTCCSLFVHPPCAVPAWTEPQRGAPICSCQGHRAPLHTSPLHTYSAPTAGRGRVSGAYLSVAKCPGGFLPV